MTGRFDWCASLFPIIVIPIIFIVIALGFSIITLERIPWPWGQPGQIVARHSF